MSQPLHLAVIALALAAGPTAAQPVDTAGKLTIATDELRSRSFAPCYSSSSHHDRQ